MTSAVELTVVVPTVAGREDWLEACLNSIRAAISHERVTVVVSGNGAGSSSRRIAEAAGFIYLHRNPMMASEDHWRLLPLLVDSGYLWFFADDDLMPVDAVSVVLASLRNHPSCVALLGRSRVFGQPQSAGSGPPIPEAWQAGFYKDLPSLAAATAGKVNLGAFVVHVGSLETEDYDRFAGTSHAIFGQLWMAIARNIAHGVQTVSEVLVDSRLADKAWDDSYIRTGAGLSRYFGLLPAEVSAERRSRKTSLPLREFARVSWLYRVGDTFHLRAFASNYKGLLARLSPVLVPIASPLAKTVKWFERESYLGKTLAE